LQDTPKKQLSLFDSTCLIVGIIIGVGIYQMAPNIAKGAPHWWGLLLIWIVGGFISLCGALNYAELATAYPREGGDYVYLSKAYGRWAGFLFGWGQLSVVRPGDIAVMAFAFATYGCRLYDPLADTSFPYCGQVYACGAVAILTLINIMGVRQGKWTQNFLTLVKAAGLLTIVGAAVAAPRVAPAAEVPFTLPTSVALVLVLFTFGGWNEMAYVAAEVKDSRRNIVRALVLGTVAVTVLYVLVNGAFLYTLGFEGLAASEAVAADAVSSAAGDLGPRLISALVCISALGAVNGLVFTGARISYAVGTENRALAQLGRWNARTGTPVRALLAQGVIAIALILFLRSFMDAIIYTAVAVYSFYLATNLAVVVLRRKEPDVERPYRVTLYPIPTIIFCAVCGFLIYSTVDYALKQKPWTVIIPYLIVMLGLPIYWLTTRRGQTPVKTDRQGDAD